jgi:type I restriction enzyme S subunit
LIKYAQITEAAAQPYLVKQGDILIVRGNANPDLVGKCGIVDSFPAGCIYPDITMRVMFRSKGPNAVLPGYAATAWNHPIVHNQILRRAKTSNGTLKINNRDVKQIILPLPLMQDQKRIVELTGAVDRKVEALRSVANAHAELKKSLMHDLLTGKVRTNQLELDEVAA